jgi:ketol-acid reductoisomerase
MHTIEGKKIAILGYGNQGRAQALNLRDSGITVSVGSRAGKSADLAKEDGFEVFSFFEAVKRSDVCVFLLPDPVIPRVYHDLANLFYETPKIIGFSHSFAYHFGFVEKIKGCDYFLVAPKGAGALLRQAFQTKQSLMGAYAVEGNNPDLKELAKSYAKAIGCGDRYLIETTFQEEVECDLFGEQVVLCGGFFELMNAAYETLVKKGLNPEMAFLECCYEGKLILDLWMQNGPLGVTQKISPTAFYGGLTRGKRVVAENLDGKLDKIYSEIHDGTFAKQWMEEVEKGMPLLVKEQGRLENSPIEKVYQNLKKKIY